MMDQSGSVFPSHLKINSGFFFFYLLASVTWPQTVVPEPTGETWLRTLVAVETLLFAA